MFARGTIINALSIILGGLLGKVISRFFNEKQQQAINVASGISVIFIGIAGSMEGLLSISEQGLSSGRSMFTVLSLAIGTIIGELLKIEDGFEAFGEWLKEKTGNSKDNNFINGFVTASLTVCIGAMAIVGAIQDGINNDYSTLAVKSVLDFIIVAIMSSSLGNGCLFSFVPVFIWEGSVTILARVVAPLLTEAAIANLSLIGSILIFCVGINLVFGKKVSVANMLPAVLVAVIFAYLPFNI